jgi:transketolase
MDNQTIEAPMLEKFTDELPRDKASCIRRDVVSVSCANGAGHIAPSLSCIDILVALYYQVMNLSTDPSWEGRDRLVFSKAHGCYGLYAILADLGYIDRSDWDTFYRGSWLSGCVERHVEHGLEVGCGALGHGLPMATGMAFGARLQHKNYRVYCIVGDGEMQEGSNWEALQFAVKHNLSNLTIIIDSNALQAMDFLDNVLTVKGCKDDLRLKLEAFGCVVEECDGHNPTAIATKIEQWRMHQHALLAPQALLAKTIKGYGLLCMENIPKFHFRLPTEEEIKMGNRYE